MAALRHDTLLKDDTVRQTRTDEVPEFDQSASGAE
jgi:hypothetical protein